jgi:GlcNAc-PI de-N-acetylase
VLAGVTSAVIVAAHPDDEVLGAGGLISVLAASRARLRLVAVTDGEHSHLGHGRPLHPGDGGPAAMTLDPGYFRDRYAASADPWGLAERWYEARKYALSVAMLPREQGLGR